jgi:aminotransferase
MTFRKNIHFDDPYNKMINIFQPSLGDEEIDAIREVFESNWVGRGKKTEEFEQLISQKIQTSCDNVLTTTSYTEGIFQILEYLDFPIGSEVILPSISFVGTANAIIHYKLETIFCDVDIRTLNPSVRDIEDKISDKTRAIILIHYGGVPCDDMDEIIKLCEDKNIVLIEDNACSPFSTYKDKNTGTLGDFGIWSFDSMKILVTGDGGLVFSKSKHEISILRERMCLGLEFSPGMSGSVKKDWWEFDISYEGRRSIMNDITSAIGICQLNKVSNFIEKRKNVHNTYNRMLSKLDWLSVPNKFSNDVTSSYFLYWIQLENKNVRDRLALHLKDNNIYTTFKYYPLHKIKYYDKKYSLPKSEVISNITLCLPIHQGLKELEVNKIVNTLRSFKI